MANKVVSSQNGFHFGGLLQSESAFVRRGDFDGNEAATDTCFAQQKETKPIGGLNDNMTIKRPCKFIYIL